MTPKTLATPEPNPQIIQRGTTRLVSTGITVVLFSAALVATYVPDQGFAALTCWLLALCAGFVTVLVWNPIRGEGSLPWRSRLRQQLVRGEVLAVGLLLVVGGFLRLYDLGGIPGGLHGDEAEFGLIVESILAGQGAHPFGTVFLSDPALYVYFQAPFQALFGNTIVGLRIFAALCGVATLIAFYMLMRRLFGSRPALLALALLAGSAAHIHFSRMGIAIAELPLLACLCFLALTKAAYSRRPVCWYAAGIFAGLAVYFHFTGRVLPFVVGLYLIHLLFTKRRAWRDWLSGAGLVALGGFMTLAPMGVAELARPSWFVDHLNMRLIFADWPRVTAHFGTDSLPLVLLGQLWENLAGFFILVDRTQFYTYVGSPMLTPLLAAPFFLGIGLLLGGIRESRYALLAFWFWSVVLICVISNDPPQAHRLVVAVPAALAGIALVLDVIMGWSSRRLVGSPIPRFVVAGAFLVPVIAGIADDLNYFNPAVVARAWESTSAQARYVASLGPTCRVYALSAPYVYFTHGATRFLAPQVEGKTVEDPDRGLPEAVPTDKNLAFLVYPHMQQYLQKIEARYPGGVERRVTGSTNQLWFTAYLVPRSK